VTSGMTGVHRTSIIGERMTGEHPSSEPKKKKGKTRLIAMGKGL